MKVSQTLTSALNNFVACLPAQSMESIYRNKQKGDEKDLMISNLTNILYTGPSSYRKGVDVDFHNAYTQSRELY
jgi:hypothetical protein